MDSIDDIIRCAKEARSQWLGSKGKAIFGDCGIISRHTVRNLEERGIEAFLAHGHFLVSTGDKPGFEHELCVDHTWVVCPEHTFLDPTIDQFFSELDIDLVTSHRGIYFPPLDGELLLPRYELFSREI